MTIRAYLLRPSNNPRNLFEGCLDDQLITVTIDHEPTAGLVSEQYKGDPEMRANGLDPNGNRWALRREKDRGGSLLWVNQKDGRTAWTVRVEHEGKPRLTDLVADREAYLERTNALAGADTPRVERNSVMENMGVTMRSNALRKLPAIIESTRDSLIRIQDELARLESQLLDAQQFLQAKKP